MSTISLFDLFPDETGIVKKLKPADTDTPQARTLRRLMDLGLIEGTPVTCVGVSVFGSPKAYCIRGAVLALRREEASLIEVEIQ